MQSAEFEATLGQERSLVRERKPREQRLRFVALLRGLSLVGGSKRVNGKNVDREELT